MQSRRDGFKIPISYQLKNEHDHEHTNPHSGFFLSFALLPLANGASPARIPDNLPLDAVKWTGGFWQDRMQRLRDIHLPGVLDGSFMSVENGSTFLNLLRAAKLEEGGAQGSTWSDGDCYLVLDTVARLQALPA